MAITALTFGIGLVAAAMANGNSILFSSRQWFDFAAPESGVQTEPNPVLSLSATTPEIVITPLPNPFDSLPSGNDSLHYPLHETSGDFISSPNDNPFYLQPSAVEQHVEYDPLTGNYILTETLNGIQIRPTTYLTFEEYWQYRQQELRQEYWGTKAGSSTVLTGKGIGPKLYVGNELFSDIFGQGGIDIRPTGSINLEIGMQSQYTANPVVRSDNQRFTSPLFNQDINMGVTGKIGDKMKVDINYNTQAVFNFDNQVKLEYAGGEDDIIQEIRAGNVNFQLPVSLIPGSQNLFGIQTKLRFGRLTLNTVLSQQRSQSRNLQLQSGAQVQKFEVQADQYDENRHFFISQYFRDNFEKAVSKLPYINSPITITRLDVYVNDTRGTPDDTQRDIIAFADLGEYQPYNTYTQGNPDKKLPENNSNNLYTKALANPQTRILSQVTALLDNPAGDFRLTNISDYAKSRARKLDPDEYTYDPQLGYVSLNFQLRPNEVLAVAYEYTTIFGGRYQVGELADNIFTDSQGSNPRVLFLKLIKPATELVKRPIWDLMMRNVYPLGAYQVDPTQFRLDVYYEDPAGGDLRYLPEGTGIKGRPLVQIFNLDRNNFVNEPYPDGVFDFIESKRDFDGQQLQSNAQRFGTINTRTGRIYFPVLEPFGKFLENKFLENGNSEAIAKKYVYTQLYDSTRTVAGDFPQFNRFVLKGTYKASVSSEISLGAFNIPPGSVKVSAGGKQLVEGTDYTIDYNLGRLTILNEAYTNSGTPVSVSFEDNATFGIQQRNYMGTRADYRIHKDFNLGATFVRLSERPFTQKVNYGDAPIANMMVGADANYFKETPWITRVLDKLPFYSTKETSSLRVSTEVAGFIPGLSGAIQNNDCGDNGAIYIDDFEGTKAETSLGFPWSSWVLASTPRNGDFPEAWLNDNLAYGVNRARLAWYQIDGTFYSSSNISDIPDEVRTVEALSDHRVRLVAQRELFPNKQLATAAESPLFTFDVAYYPSERGPYNFDTDGIENISKGIETGGDDLGKLREPKTRWAGIMRESPFKNFESTNVEFLEFWMMNPFNEENDTDEGELLFQMGNISEDILKDARQSYENSLPGPGDNTNGLVNTNWGKINNLHPIVINAFDNDPDTRQMQDVGLDGLNNDEEAARYNDYLSYLQSLPANARIDSMIADPSGDDFRHFRAGYRYQNTNILSRYKEFNNPQGNTPRTDSTSSLGYSVFYSNEPDKEDVNKNSALDDMEAFFEYKIPFKSGMSAENTPYLADQRTINVKLRNGQETQETWYYFRVPVQQYTQKVGDVNFRNVESIRMIVKGFAKPIVMRFGRLNLVRNNWRRYPKLMREEGEYLPDDNNADAFFNVSALSIEEHSGRYPINYRIPPCIQRVRVASSVATTIQQNEQAMNLQVSQLRDGEARGVYKRVDMDMRNFKRMKMFVHAESLSGFNDYCGELEDGEVTVFVRLGDDFEQNFYEYEIPVKVTLPADTVSADLVWPKENIIDIPLETLVNLKLDRNFNTTTPLYNKPFYKTIMDTLENGYVRKIRLTVVGSPDLGNAKNILVGVRNPLRRASTLDTDDGLDKCAEIWVNELRLTDPQQNVGWAGLARADLKLADLGNFTVSANAHTAGFGTLEQKLEDRYFDNYIDYNASANLEMGKLLPKAANIRIPTYANITESVSTPKYDPYNTDVLLKQNIDSVRLYYGADSAKLARKQRQTAATVKTINFTNVRKERGANQKNHIWDVENFGLTYSYTESDYRDPIIESDKDKRHLGSLTWGYNAKPFYIEPFAKLIRSNSPYLKLIKDINFNIVPSSLSFRNDVERRLGTMQLRALTPGELQLDPIYEKYFSWKRIYGFRYNPMRSVSIDFNATNQAVIDEPQQGKTPADTLWSNIRRFGRTRQYDQDFSVSYNVPLDKLPLLSWIQLRTRYGGGYTWRANPVQLADTIGNFIGNKQNIQINGELNFAKIYNSVPFLKKIEGGGPAKKSPTKSNNKNDKKGDNTDKGKSKNDGKDKGKIKDKAKDMKDEKPQEGGKGRGKKEDENKAAADPNAPQEISANGTSAGGNNPDGNKGAAAAGGDGDDDKKGKKDKKKDKKKDSNKTEPKNSGNSGKSGGGGNLNPVVRTLLRPLLSLRRASLTYTQTNNTDIPGYIRNSRILGSDWTQRNDPRPGWDFIFGAQPELKRWLEWAAADTLITQNLYLTDQVKQGHSTKLDMKINLEPFRDFKIDLSMNLSHSKNHTEFYKFDSTNTDGFKHLSKIDQGSYSISFFTLNTMFDKLDTQRVSSTFKQFEALRPIISQRFGELYNQYNPFDEQLGNYYDPINDVIREGYLNGYGPYSQNVLIPAFLAAYTGRDASKANLNPFNMLPLPNWRVTYNGLSKLSFLREYVSNINITHGYTSTLSINNYRNNLLFDNRYYDDALQLVNDQAIMDYIVQERLRMAQQGDLDTLTNNFMPYFQIPNIIISEQLSPLIGIDVALKNGASVRFDYKKSRTLTMSFQDYQLSESRSSEFTIGAGYKIKELKIPLKLFGKKIELKNELNFNFDFSIRDNLTNLYRLDQGTSEPTQGAKVTRIAAGVDYVVSQKIRMGLFYERTRTLPYTSVSFENINSRGGLRLSLTL